MTQLSQLSDQELLKLYNQPAPDDLSALSDDELLSLSKQTKDERPIGQLEGIVNSGKQGYYSLRAGLVGMKAEAAAGRIEDASAIEGLMDAAQAQVPADVPAELLERTAGVRSAMALRAEGQRRLADESIGELMASAETLSELEERMQQIQVAPAMEAWNQAEGFAESAAAFLKNPFEITLNIQAQSMVSSVPALALGAAGAALAGPAGLAAGAGMGSYAVERSLAFLDALRDAGVDLKDKDSILEAFNNPETLARARGHAVKRGVPVALFDAASGGLAGRFTVVKEGVKRFVKGQAIETGLDMLSGAGGEATAGLVAEGKVDWKDVFAEGLGEIGPGAVETAIGARTEARRTQREAAAQARIKTIKEAIEALEKDPKAEISQEAGDYLKQMQADLKTKREAAAAAEKTRQQERAERRRGFPGRLDEALQSLGELSPDQLEAVDSNLAFLESRRGVTQESIERLIGNTPLKKLSKTAQAFLGRDLSDSQNLAAMRQVIQKRLPAKDTSAADAAAAAAKQAEAQAQELAKKARAAERKRMRQIEKSGRDPDTGEIYDYSVLQDDDLENLAEEGDAAAVAELDRRINGQEETPTDAAELLETARRLKLPTPEHAASFGRRGEFNTLREHLGTAEALRIFRNQAQGETDILEAYQEAGFNFQSVDELVDALDQRMRDGKPVYATSLGMEDLRFAKAEKPTENANDDTASQDPLTKQPTRITGPRVTSAQVAGLRKAARDRRQGMEDAFERGETPEDSQDLLPVIDAIRFEEDKKGDGDFEIFLTLGSKRLELLGEGAESEVFYDREQKVVYKVFKRTPTGQHAYTYFPRTDASGFHFRASYQATAIGIAKRVEVLNEVLGVPTEIVGQTVNDEIILKQPYAESIREVDMDGKEAYENFLYLGKLSDLPRNLDGGRSARSTKTYPATGLVRPANYWAIGKVGDRIYVIGDMHGGNFRLDNDQQARLSDPIVTEVTDDMIAEMQKTLPETAEWFRRVKKYGLGEEQRSDLRFARAAPLGSKEFTTWSSGLPVVEKGDPLPAGGFVALAYHGTTRNFSTFDPNRASPDGDQGAGFYFTNTRDDVSANYGSEMGPDITGRIERLADQILDNAEDEISWDEAHEQARRELTEHRGAVMPVYVRLEKPLILGGPTETSFDYDYTIDQETDEVSESGTLLDLFEAIRTVAREGDFYGLDVDLLISDLAVAPEIDGGGSIGASRLEHLIKNNDSVSMVSDEEGNLVSNEFMRQVWEHLGYDGVADTTVYAKFGRPRRWGRPMNGIYQSSVHFIAYTNTQVKSAIGNSGAYSRTDADITAARGPRTKKPRLTGMQSEAEIARMEAMLKEIAPGLAREYRMLIGDLRALSEAAGVPLEKLDPDTQAAISTNRRLFWFLRDNVVFDKKGNMPTRLRRDVLHEFAHAFWDTLAPDEQMELFGHWQSEIKHKNGPLYRKGKLRAGLRADIATDVQEWFAERMALQNDAWARGRTTTDSMLADAAARLRAWLEHALQLLARAFGRRYAYHADFRRFMVDGRRPMPSTRRVDADALGRRFEDLEAPLYKARQDPPDQNAHLDNNLLPFRNKEMLKYRGMDYIEDAIRRGDGNRDHAYRLLKAYFGLKQYLAAHPPKTLYDEQNTWLDGDHLILEMTGIRNDADADLLVDAIEAYDAGRPFVWPDALDLSRQLTHYARKANVLREEVKAVLAPGLLRLLTVEELQGMRVDTAARISALYSYLPPIQQLRRLAELGREGRKWYTWVDETLRAMAPDEKSHWQLAGILAATSPSKSVEDSVRITLKVWNGWVAAGKPTDALVIEKLVRGGVTGNKKWGRNPLGQRGMDSDVNNIVNVFSSASYQEALSKMTSPKVTPFYRAIMGELDAIVNDTWMARIFDVDKNTIGAVAMNRALNAMTRRLARQLGWEPAEVQAALWMTARVLGDRIRNEAKRKVRRRLRVLLAADFTQAELAPGDDIASLLTGEKYGTQFTAAGFDASAGRTALDGARERTLRSAGAEPRSGIRVSPGDRKPVAKRLVNRFNLERIADEKEPLPADLRYARAQRLSDAPGENPLGRGGPAVDSILRTARIDHLAPEQVNVQRLSEQQLDERISALTEEWINRKKARQPVEAILDLRDEARTEKDRRLQERMPPIPGPVQADLHARLEALDTAIEQAQAAGNLAKLTNLQEQRRQIRDQLRGQSAQAEPGETGEPSPFNDDEARQYTVNRTKVDRLRGASLGKESSAREALNSLGELLKGFRGSIPEIPTFGSRSRKFTGLKLGLKLLRRGDARVRREAADAVKAVLEPIMQIKGKPLQANAYAKLQRLVRQREKLLGKPQVGAERMLAVNKAIAQLRAQINDDPYILFQDVALFRDLWFRSQLTDDRGQPLTLPMNLNAEEINDYLESLHARLARHPERQAIEASLTRHKELADATLKDLLARNLTVPEDYQNPHYFPHIVLEHTKGRLERVRVATEDDFRAYLVKPVGSSKTIETDYIKAMFYHIAAVKAHNLRSDIVANYFQPLDIMEKVRAYAKELQEQYGRPVSWREAYNTGFASSHQVYTVDDRLPLHPDLMINREVLGKALGRVLSEGPLGPQLKKLGVEGITVRAQDIHEALAAGEKEVWILPNEAAEALRGIIKREWPTDNLVTKFLGGVQGLWKRNILFAPWNYIRYEFNNTMADLEKLFSVDPGMARKLPQAFGEVRKFFGGAEPSLALRKAFELGVLESITANEINAVAQLREFEQFATSAQRAVSMMRRYSTISASRLREATFRYAKYLADLERMQRGAAPIYAGAYGRDIEAIGDSSEGAGDADYIKAAEISLKTFGDYFDLTVNGNRLRQLLIPFYSWTEVNFKYHANLFRNMADLVREGDITKGQAAGRIAGAVSIRGSRIVAGFMLRLALPYLAVMLWNNTGDREELEETLSAEDRRRLHIILGKDDEGRTMVVYLPTAFSDVIKWFSGPTFAQLATDYLAGRVDLPTALGEFARQVPNDAVNNLLQGVGPLYKVPYTLLAKKSVFPDVTDQRTIAAHDMQRVILGQATDQFTAEVITRLINKDYLASRDVGDWAQQIILQVRRRDPEQWAYYEVRDKADDFLEAQTGRSRDSNFNAPDQQVLRNFRRSVYRGDVNNALRFYNRLLDLGYTSERFDASLRSQNPLSGLPNELKAPFIEQLSPFQQKQLERAMKYYTRIQAAEGYEKALFPDKRNVDYPFTPDTDLLKQIIQDTDQMSDEESRALAGQLILEALTR